MDRIEPELQILTVRHAKSTILRISERFVQVMLQRNPDDVARKRDGEQYLMKDVVHALAREVMHNHRGRIISQRVTFLRHDSHCFFHNA